MPSNPTTLAELVSALEAQVRSERDNAGCWRDEGDEAQAKHFDVRADLMDRAAKVLRAVNNVTRRDVQNGPDCTRCDERERVCDCAKPEVEILPAAIIHSVDLDAAITRALGGSDGE
jgi:hypothetical protein